MLEDSMLWCQNEAEEMMFDVFLVPIDQTKCKLERKKIVKYVSAVEKGNFRIKESI